MVLSLNTMPNSYDDTIWDQIQSSLDRLNSDYEKRSKILAEIQATCTKICATLHNHQQLQQPPIFQIQAKSESHLHLLHKNSTNPAADISSLPILQVQTLESDYTEPGSATNSTKIQKQIFQR
ncbi:uncharacterized protein DS421_8g224380 [Arachis hypogaea]|nr:uncharacterized protein DS421_8g224380 [Arachis hypogaea]